MSATPDDSLEGYIGKRLLVGLTYVDKDDEKNTLKKEQIFGNIKSFGKNGLILDRSDGKGEFTLPPDLNALEPANRGKYHAASGALAINPDYVASWTLVVAKEAVDDLHRNSGNIRKWDSREEEEEEEGEANEWEEYDG